MIVENGIQLLELEMKNIMGMSCRQSFDSPLCIVYGYNRSGKTIFLKGIQHAFKGFRSKSKYDDYTKIIGGNPEGYIRLVFGFNKKIYRIFRTVNSSNETLEFIQLLITLEEYLELTPPLRAAAWKKATSINSIIEKTVVIGSVIDKFTDKLKEIKLYPEIINRLIAIENIQEYKNAAKEFHTEEGGFDAIKDLIFKDLQSKSIALDHIQISTQKAYDQLGVVRSTNIDDWNSILIEAKSKIKDEIKDTSNEAQLHKIIDALVIAIDPEQKIKQYQKDMELFTTECAKLTQKVVERNSSTENDIENKYNPFEEHWKSLEFEDLEVAIDSYKKNSKIVIDLYGDLSSNQVRLQRETVYSERKVPAVDFSSLIQPKMLEKGKSLESGELVKTDIYGSITKDLSRIINMFNKVAKNYARYNEILQKFNILKADLGKTHDNYVQQRDKMKNPRNIPASELTKYNTHIDVDENSGEKIMQIYMTGEELQQYIEGNNPIKVSPYLMMMLGKDSTIDKKLLDQLTKEINERIKLLDEAIQIEKGLEKNTTDLNSEMESFKQIKQKLEKDDVIVNSWNTQIITKKGLCERFIQKIRNHKVNYKNFAEIKKGLQGLKDLFISDLRAAYNDSGATYNDEVDIIDNAKELLKILQKQKNGLDFTQQSIANIRQYLDIKLPEFKDICGQNITTQDLENCIIPTIKTILAAFQKRIDLGAVEDQVMKNIISKAKLFYKRITGEDSLEFEKLRDEKSGKLFIRSFIKTRSGVKIPMTDDGPSGSEQAAISLGIMVALAETFHGFVIIDEVADRFDYDTRMDFYKMLQESSGSLFMMIILKVDSDRRGVAEELSQIQGIFKNSQILTPYRNLKTGQMTMKVAESASDIQPASD